MGGKHAKAKVNKKVDPLKLNRTKANKERRATAIAARKVSKPQNLERGRRMVRLAKYGPPREQEEAA